MDCFPSCSFLIIEGDVKDADFNRRKKMPNHQQFSPTYNNYVPAILCHQKDNWQIEYYVFSPVTNQMERKRMRLNKLRRHCGTLKEFKAHAANIVQTINNQLAGGWSPFGESENIRYYTTLDEVMLLYIEEKQKELKPDTLRSYKSFCKIFGEWCLKTVPGCKCIQFNRVLAIRYMDYVYNERKVSARSYNNQLKMARAFFSWAVEKCYCKENPFEMLRVKKEAEKRRIIIDADTRSRIRDYFERENPGFIVVMELIYTSFLRPIEASRVQIGQIDLSQHCIHMSADKTKNGKQRAAPLSDELCERLSKMIEGVPPEWYLIGYGGDEDKIRSKISETGMENYVIILGKRSNPYPYMKACDIYAQPSRYEGKSVTVREAQMLCKPVVVTNYPTAKSQIKNGVDGVIVPVDNIGCADEISKFIQNIHLQQKIMSYLHSHDYGNEKETIKIERMF